MKKKIVWIVRTNVKTLPLRELVLLLESFMLDKEILDQVDGPKIVKTKLGFVIKVRCSKKNAKILLKCAGVWFLEEARYEDADWNQTPKKEIVGARSGWSLF